jgi:hypothetical protein
MAKNHTGFSTTSMASAFRVALRMIRKNMGSKLTIMSSTWAVSKKDFGMGKEYSKRQNY